MKNLKMSALVIGVFGIFLGISGCAPSGGGGGESSSGSSGESTVLEGTWVGLCESSVMSYIQDTYIFAGNTIDLNRRTYSDSSCTNLSSGDDLRTSGSFNLEDEEIIDGKQLKKINWVLNTTYAEGLIALFFPVGQTTKYSSALYIDGDKAYWGDGQSQDFSGNSPYTNSTHINYDSYIVRQ